MSANAPGREGPRRQAEVDEDRDASVMATAFAQLDPVALAAAVGCVFGLGLFGATAVLLIRGGVLVGLHLQGLSHYLPGYSVSWGGALIGAVEGALVGAVIGALLAWIWNAYHRWFVALALARETRRELQEL